MLLLRHDVHNSTMKMELGDSSEVLVPCSEIQDVTSNETMTSFAHNLLEKG
jgi:hypothetical protein